MELAVEKPVDPGNQTKEEQHNMDINTKKSEASNGTNGHHVQPQRQRNGSNGSNSRKKKIIEEEEEQEDTETENQEENGTEKAQILPQEIEEGNIEYKVLSGCIYFY
jgi:hypothetical protein